MMLEDKQKKEIILILPYLNVNTTSAARFKSFISAFTKAPNIELRIIEIVYPIKKSYFAGLEFNDEHSLKSDILKIKPRFNMIQNIGFWFLNHDYRMFWRFCQLFHLVLLKKDIFYPGHISINSNKQDGIVIVSGGHFSFFNTASHLAKKLDFKLVLDYRDPWTLGYPALGGVKFVHLIKTLVSKKEEINFIKQASLITTVSNSLKKFFPNQFLSKVRVVANGANFNQNEVDLTKKSEKFNILYAGTIYTPQLSNSLFFQAFKKFIENKDQSKIQLQFIGSFYNRLLKQLINEYNLNSVTLITKRLNREDLKNHLNEASVFLHLRYGKNKDIISSKQADYLAFQRPILLPISDDGDIAQSIIENNAGYVCNDIESIVKTLEELWLKFENGENFYIKQNDTFLNSISRDAIADDFVEKILEL